MDVVHELKGKHIDTRLRLSLDAEDCARIKSCDDGTRCGSLYCSSCQTKAWEISSRRLFRHITKTNMARIKASGNHITGVVGITKSGDIDSVKSLIKKDRARLSHISRKMKSQFGTRDKWFEIVYEIESVHVGLLAQSDCEYKQSNISDLIDEYSLHGEVFLFFVHWHGVTNMTRDELLQVFGTAYLRKGKCLKKTDSDTGLYIQSFHEDKHLIDSCEVMARYALKNAVNFKLSYKGNDLGDVALDSVRFRELVECYQAISGRNFSSLFVSGKSDSEFANAGSDVSWALTESVRSCIREQSF